MVINFRIQMILGAAMLLWGCATTAPEPEIVTEQPARVPVDPQAATKAGTQFAMTSITQTTLPDGSCGMVLWTLDASRPIPVLRYVAGKSGEISIDNVTYDLTRVSVGGDIAFGVFPRQSFVGGEGIELGVDLQFGQGFDGGSYIQRGVITLNRPEGPTLVTPVAGIAGCRTR